MSVSEGMTLLPSILVGVSGCLVYYVISFYYKVSRFPKGPTPLPYIGNILNFRNSKKSMHETLNDMSDKNTPVYTIYLGHKPIVVIADTKLGIESMRRAAFAGRPDYGMVDIFCEKGSIDVFFADFSREWEVLKKVAHEAIKKYTISARHPQLVAGVVDRIFDRTDSDGKRMDITPHDDFSLLMNAVLASAAFGKEYKFDDPEFLTWKLSMERLQVGNPRLMLLFFVPFFRYVFRGTWAGFLAERKVQNDFIKKCFNENKEKFDGEVSNFCQALLSAKQDAEEEYKSISKYMTFSNLNNAMLNLFFAGEVPFVL
jgi:hypothetical protein